MADSYIQVAADGTGKKMQTVVNTVGVDSVHAEVVTLADAAGTPLTILPVSLDNIPLPPDAALATTQTDGNQKTQIIDSHGSVISFTDSAIDVNQKTIGGNTIAVNAGNATAGTQRVVIATDQATVPVSISSVPSHAVTNAGTFAVQASITAAQTLANVTTVGTITNVVHVDDNSGSLTVDNAGTFAVQAAQSGTWTVQPGNTANTTAWKVDGSAVTQPTKEARAATPTQSSVANNTGNVTLLAANSSRLGATIFNDDTAGTGATLKLKLGATASATSFTIAIAPQGYYEVPFNYTGIIDGIASAGTGNARITELAA